MNPNPFRPPTPTTGPRPVRSPTPKLPKGAPTGYGAGNYTMPSRSRHTNPASPAYRTPTPQPTTTYASGTTNPTARPTLGQNALSQAQAITQAQIAALPPASTVTSPYEAQIQDVKGLTAALIQHLQNSSSYQANLATGLPQAVQNTGAALAAQTAQLAGAAGGNPAANPALPATQASGTMASLGTSFANELQAQAAAAPTAAMGYDATIRNNEQKALADYILNPARTLQGQLPSLTNTIQQQLQGQANTDRNYAFNQSQAAERKREFGVTQATQKQIAASNERTALASLGVKSSEFNTTLANTNANKQLDRQLRLKLAKLSSAAAQQRASAAAQKSADAAERANQKEGRSAWNSAMNRMYSVIDSATKTTTSSGAKTSKVVGYDAQVLSAPDDTGKRTPSTLHYGANWDGKTVPAGYTLLGKRAVTKTTSGPGGTKMTQNPQAANRAFVILKNASNEYGLGFSDGYIRSIVNSYAGQKQTPTRKPSAR